MRITYFALKNVQVGDDQREPGDLVPEARDWPYLHGYVQDGTVAPVLVATLPDEQQMMLLDWEDEQAQAVEAAKAKAAEREAVEAVEAAKAAKAASKNKTPEKVGA